MDFRFERIQNHIEGCLLQAGVFKRTVEGSQLFDVEIVEKSGTKWLAIGAGVSSAESFDYFNDEPKQQRAMVPIQVSPSGQASILLVVRPQQRSEVTVSGKYVMDFSTDVGSIECRQGCYVRIDELDTPSIRQIRWELDPVEGHKPPQEKWLQPWAQLVGCNPAHAPSHWHINSQPIEQAGPRQRGRPILPPELRLATGLPNPLLLILSIANWLRAID